MSEVKEHAVLHQETKPAQEFAPPSGVVAKIIADQLWETEASPRRLILRLVKHLGANAALAILKETLEIEMQGGMMLPDGSRRHILRSPVYPNYNHTGSKTFWCWQGPLRSCKRICRRNPGQRLNLKNCRQ